MPHTPGPWHTGTDEDGHVVYNESGGFIADAGLDDGDEGEEAANARLIAAAPDLLAACQEIFDRLNRKRPISEVPGVDAETGAWMRSTREKLDNIIAKATQ